MADLESKPRLHWSELREIGRAGLASFVRRWWLLALIVGFGVVMTLFFSQPDNDLLKSIQTGSGTATAIARAASFWGDWPGWAVLGGFIWLFGTIRKQTHWRQIGLACLLATLMAGVTVMCFRPTLGRPRPYTGIPDGFHGPSLNTKYHSFMSGHSAASFAAATALVITAPPIGIPAVGAAAAVAWSRLQLDKHHPSDVIVGAATGILCGWCFGRAARRKNQAAE